MRKIILRRGIVLIFLIVLTSISMHIFAQKITLSKENITLEAALDEIKLQSGFTFAYSPQVIDVDRIISVFIDNQELFNALTILFKGTNIGFEIKAKKVLLFVEPKDSSSPLVNTQQKSRRIIGTVKDEKGEPLIGASVTIKGTTNGTITDTEGNFNLSVTEKSDLDEYLDVSYIGYISKSIPIKNKSVFTVELIEDSKTIDEVVVVAYGVQKKSSVTGAIDVISGKTIEKTPVPNIAYSLQGTVPGLIIVDQGGKPGSTPSINIRGISTMGSTEPLVVIDGIPAGLGDFYALSPGDVESISVLKDASSAAIYGSRASNGVLIVTTRKGDREREPVVDISFSNSSQTPVKVPTLNNSWDYAMLVNESYTQAGGNIQYTDEQIQMMRDGSNPDFYTNTNWWKTGVKPHDNMNQANVRVAGGNGKTSYMISAGYTSQQGLIDYTNFSKYNTRVNVNSQLIDNLEVTAGVSYYRDNQAQPDHYSNFFSSILNMPPYLPIKRSNGDWGHLNNEDTNPIAWITDGGNTKSYDNNLLTNGIVNWKIIKGLSLKGQISNNLWEIGNSSIYRTITFINEDGTKKYSNNPNSVSRSMTERNQLTLQSTLEYEKRITENYFKAIVGYTDEHYTSHWVGANRRYIPDNTMEEIDAATGTGDNQSNWGSSDEWRMRSYFGRINYDYASCYFLEFNTRYDGSSRLAPGMHYSFFPSGSVGWRISEENFMKPTRRALDNLKFRMSYGQLGNQTIGLYQYADVLANNPKEYMFGHQWVPGAYLDLLPNYDLTWEISTIFDIGTDFTLFNNKLSGSFDWYRKKTSGILLQLPVSAVIGVPISVQNAGVMASWGEELQLTWRDRVKQFNYGITLSLSDQMNEILDLKGTSPLIYNSTINEEGKPLNTLYGYKCLGFFSSREEIDNSPKPEGYASQIKVGDLKYADISGPEGKPDGKIDRYDKTDLGWSAPRYMYGLDITGEWKGVDFRVFVQGVGKRDEYVYGDIIFNPTSKNVLDDRWNPNKTVEENMKQAKLPRFVNGQQNNYEISSFYVRNAAYLRMKNIQLGYTVPKNITRKISFEKVRLYVSANNLFTLTSFPYIDPEGSPNGAYYPQLRSLTFGVDLTIGKN